MKKRMIRKIFVVGIFVLFFGAGVISAIDNNIERKENVSKKQNEYTGFIGLDDGLVGYWSFNEGSDSTAYDDSGNGYQGTINDASWSNGIYGSALEFDGDDFVAFDSPVLNTPPYSVCSWVHPDSFSVEVGKYIMANGGESNDAHGFCLLLQNPGNWFFAGKKTDKIAHIQTYPASSSEEWVFLCGTWDGNGLENFDLYVNGELVSGTRWTEDDSGNEERNLRIGASSYELGGFQGLIDEVRIYDRELSQEEIQELYENPSGLKSAFIFGRIDNLNMDAGSFITFEAENVRAIKFSPFEFNQYISGETIRISEEKLGLLLPGFIFGFFNANI